MENKKRLIDADALQMLLWPIATGLEKEYGSLGGAVCGVMHHIDNAPTVDAVEVVRCRDCKHREDRLYCRLRKQPVIVMNTDFCSYGERKDNE